MTKEFTNILYSRENVARILNQLPQVTIANAADGPIVAPSQVCGASYGLYADRNYRKGEKVTVYGGVRVTEDDEGDYVLDLYDKDGNLVAIDAEEADRLDLSLDIFESLARDPELDGWNGLGFVLQAYQKRATYVASWLIALANDTGRSFMVRLVKGAYWDGEIKHAQEHGLDDYPVYTRKCHTDLSYQRCAEILLQSPARIFPQFATHNAHTVALVQALTGTRTAFEFQRLHGMGHLLYDELQDDNPETAVRVYAPVGTHKDLLPYLVRRLLENGANSSFVNRFLDAEVAPSELLRDPLEETCSHSTARHMRIPLPRQLEFHHGPNNRQICVE